MARYRLMKTLIFLLFPLFSFAQCPDDFWSRAVLIRDTPVEVQVGPGVSFQSLVIERSDTTSTETWVIMKKGSTIPVPKPAIKIEGESATSIVRAAAVGTVIGHILPGAVIKYPAVEGRSKVVFRYSRGYTGNGTMVMKIGTVSNTLVFPSTGGWGDYKEIEYPVSGSGPIEITSNEIGSCNYDYFVLTE